MSNSLDEAAGVGLDGEIEALGVKSGVAVVSGEIVTLGLEATVESISVAAVNLGAESGLERTSGGGGVLDLT